MHGNLQLQILVLWREFFRRSPVLTNISHSTFFKKTRKDYKAIAIGLYSNIAILRCTDGTNLAIIVLIWLL